MSKAEKSSSPSQSSSAPIAGWKRGFIDITGGTIGGVGLVLVGHPFDTLKVRLQTQSHINPLYSGLGDCVAKTWKNEGFGGFYKGFQSPLFGQMFFNAVQFFAYGIAKEQILKYSSSSVSALAPGKSTANSTAAKNSAAKDLTIPQYFLAGALTGAAVAFVEGPIDLFKTQLQTQIFQPKPLYSTFWGCVKYITQNYGIRGIYQGITPTLCRNVPAVSMYFGVYDYARQQMCLPGQKVENLSPMKVMTAGALGGFAYWIATYPMDVIKSTIQSDSPNRSQGKYLSIKSTASALYQQGGINRFFVGISPCLMRAAPANAVCFFFYEYTVKVLNKELAHI